jgi:hypothetical protein
MSIGFGFCLSVICGGIPSDECADQHQTSPDTEEITFHSQSVLVGSQAWVFLQKKFYKQTTINAKHAQARPIPHNRFTHHVMTDNRDDTDHHLKDLRHSD